MSTLADILDGSSATYWEAESAGAQWIVFDMGEEHEVSRFKLRTVSNGAAPKDCALERAASREGPWTQVANFTAQQSSELQYFPFQGNWGRAGGLGNSRYWRLSVHNTHDTSMAAKVSQVGFHGVTRRSSGLLYFASEGGSVHCVHTVDGSSRWGSLKDDLGHRQLPVQLGGQVRPVLMMSMNA